MAGRPRQPSNPTSSIGRVFTENVEALLPVCFPDKETEGELFEALAKAAGIGKETVRRSIKGGGSPLLNNVDSIARGLGITTPQLLTRGFGKLHAIRLRAGADTAA